MKTVFKGCLLIIVSCFFLGCGINTITFFVIPTIQQSRWNASKPQNYSLTVNYGYMGGTSPAYQEKVTGEVAQIIHSDGGTRDGEKPTIEELFDEIKQQTLNPFGLLLLYWTEYDPTYSFPNRIIWNDFDLGDVTEITDFTPE
ncbi:MAG: DUF6174 domain-containing protein [Anaerolineae bacterium]